MTAKQNGAVGPLDFARIRYSAETELERVLEKDFALEQYYDVFDNRDEVESITNEMLSNTVLLSEAIAPRIYSLCSEIQKKLGFAERIDFYLLSSAEVNAFSINGYDYVPNIICFTSALIQQMNDDELRFVIGHEIGHLIYDHNKLDVVRRFLNKNEDERLPAMITLHYLRFIKYAEISADRIGFIAMPDINVVTNTFFKLTCGLSQEHLNFDAAEYLKQLDRIREIGVGDLFSFHPNSMIRIQALMHFAESELTSQNSSSPLSRDELDAKVSELLALLETKPKKEKEQKIVEFLAAVGLYMAILDQDSLEDKWNLLFDWISDYTTQPEIYLQFKDETELEERVKAVCKHFAAQQDNDKFALMEKIVCVTLIDGRLELNEKRRLAEIAAAVNITPDALNLIIRNCSESVLTPIKRIMLGNSN